MVEPSEVFTRHLTKPSDCIQNPRFDTLHQKQTAKQINLLKWKIAVNNTVF
ncbi:hypothetical protein I79_014094 [Cricetulus griseus]|uniref:Uncharacterized protein n=1 Tax=Cricetulus griseus TaxID=10029 RepID=G3HT73_CRIGR|nr:hypothetical protein I79_014094 [Cricetulus griseus]